MVGQQFRYRVPYRRTEHWWTQDWADISSWCDRTLPEDSWEYLMDGFVFTEERYRTWFLLTWGSN